MNKTITKSVNTNIRKKLNINPSTVQLISIVIFIVIMVTFFSVMTNRFLTSANILNIIRQVTVISMLAFGMTFVILVGGIDLSVGSIVGSSALFAALINLSSGSLFLTILGAILSGTVVGIVNGIIISKLKIPDIIATLSMMSIIRGAVLVYTQATPLYGFKDNYLSLGQGYLGFMPIPIIIMGFVLLICLGILRLTKFGSHVFAVGGNREVARLSGINVDMVRIIVYAISGSTAALGGIILAARTAAAVPTAGQGYEMDAITAVVLGGTDIVGGRGSLVGTFLGMLVIGILSNGLILLGVDSYVITILKGVILLAAIAISVRRK